MIEIKGVCKKYTNNEYDNWVIQDINLLIKEGTFTSIVGRSGSGKTTLLKIMGGLLKPDKGTVFFDDNNLYSSKESLLNEFRSREMGFVFQDFLLEKEYTVYQNVEIALMISRVPRKEREKIVQNALQIVNLSEKRMEKVKKLSGGEIQRVCIARAIVNDPKYIFADEPCGNLDYENGRIVMNYLRSLVELGKTVVLITHNLEDAALTDEIVTISDGRIVNCEEI